MEAKLTDIFDVLYVIIGSIGVAIIVYGVALTIFRLATLEFKRIQHTSIYRQRESIRHRFASYLLLALEFMIAADIIVTVIHPSFEEIAILASIVGIRTLISYFLEKEVEKFNSDR